MVIAPGAHEVSFGRIAGRTAPGTRTIVVTIDGRRAAQRDLGRSRFDFTIELPRRDLRLTVTAIDGQGRRASTVVGPVFGLPQAGKPRAPPRRSYEDARLGRTIRALARGFSGTCAIFVQDLRTGAGAAWNARAQFPAASTLKVAIAVEVMRVLAGKPRTGSRIDRLLRKAIVPSDDKAANELLVWLGGSTSGGSARVNATFRALGMSDSEMFGGYVIQGLTPIPLRANEQPSFIGKRMSAWDFSRLLRFVHLAAEGKGPLARRGGFVPTEARFLLYLLAHAKPSWLGRYLPAGNVALLHKPGWITRGRHDGGLGYWRSGTFVAVVMTWNPRGVGVSSEVLAGRVARAAFDRFRRRAGPAASGRSARPRRG